MSGSTIPTPEVTLTDSLNYDKLYPSSYQIPEKLIFVQPFSMEADDIDYDMDSEDEQWIEFQSELTRNKVIKK